MLTASCRLDLRHGPTPDNPRSDYKLLHDAGLADLPDGTRVILLIGSRCWDLEEWAIRELHEHVARLNLDVWGDSGAAIRVWHAAIHRGSIIFEVAS